MSQETNEQDKRVSRRRLVMDFFEKEKPRKENAEPPPELVETLFDCINCGRLLLKTLKAKSVDLPVYKLLGGPYREKVICYSKAYSLCMGLKY